MDKLVGGVNPCVCATGAKNPDLVIGDKSQGAFQYSLDTCDVAASLKLPAAEAAAIVLDPKRDFLELREPLFLRASQFPLITLEPLPSGYCRLRFVLPRESF